MRVFTKQNNRKIYFRKKISYIIGNFNMNFLKYHEKAKTKHFYSNTFEKGAIPIMNRPTRILEHSVRLIDNILTTDIFNSSLKEAIIKSDYFSIQLTKEKLWEGVIKIKNKFLVIVT